MTATIESYATAVHNAELTSDQLRANTLIASAREHIYRLGNGDTLIDGLHFQPGNLLAIRVICNNGLYAVITPLIGIGKYNIFTSTSLDICLALASDLRALAQ